MTRRSLRIVVKKLMNIFSNTKGDTIIEVLLASVILSIVLAGAYSLSSRATRLNQASYERTRAANLVQEQAELLRSLNKNDLVGWNDVTSRGKQSYYDCRAPGDSVVIPDTSVYKGFFYLEGDVAASSITVNDGYKDTDNIYHTWVARSNDGSEGYQDFYVYTCWEGLGTIGNQVSGAVIRLEQP